MTAKQKPDPTSQLTQLYLDHCKEHGLEAELKKGSKSTYTISFIGNNAKLSNQTSFHKKLEIVSVLNYTFIKFSQSNLLNLYKLANEINNMMHFHCLIFQEEEDVVALRNEAHISTLVLEAGLLKDTLESGLVLLDQFIPAINLVNYGVMGVDKALETAERFSSTQNMELDLPN